MAKLEDILWWNGKFVNIKKDGFCLVLSVYVPCLCAMLVIRGKISFSISLMSSKLTNFLILLMWTWLINCERLGVNRTINANPCIFYCRGWKRFCKLSVTAQILLSFHNKLRISLKPCIQEERFEVFPFKFMTWKIINCFKYIQCMNFSHFYAWNGIRTPFFPPPPTFVASYISWKSC